MCACACGGRVRACDPLGRAHAWCARGMCDVVVAWGARSCVVMVGVMVGGVLASWSASCRCGVVAAVSRDFWRGATRRWRPMIATVLGVVGECNLRHRMVVCIM